MKDRFIYNSQKETVMDTLQGSDVTNKEIVAMLNVYERDNRELKSDKRYYMGLYDMYEMNYIDLKRNIEALIDNYTDMSICEMNDRAVIYTEVVSDLENLFSIDKG